MPVTQEQLEEAIRTKIEGGVEHVVCGKILPFSPASADPALLQQIFDISGK